MWSEVKHNQIQIKGRTGIVKDTTLVLFSSPLSPIPSLSFSSAPRRAEEIKS